LMVKDFLNARFACGLDFFSVLFYFGHLTPYIFKVILAEAPLNSLSCDTIREFPSTVTNSY
jgi:hypothetical protein